MNPFRRSWHLFKSTWAVLMADKELVFFPLLASIVTFVASVILLGGGIAILAASPQAQQSLAAADSGEGNPVTTLAFFVLLFLYYLVMSSIGTYFMTGLAGAALKRFEGGDPTFGDGMRIANSRFGSIFGFAMINATVGVLLSALRSRENAGGRIAASLGGAAWSITTFLVVPVIAAKGLSPIDAIKESGSLLRHTWGEQLVGSAGIGFFFGLLMLIAAVLGGFLAFSVSGSTAAFVTVVILTIIVVATLAVVNSSLNGIYRASVYHYADSGEVAPQYEPELIESAFRPKTA
jgi:hypothetical protein